MKKNYLFFLFLLTGFLTYAQVAINDSGSAADASAMLDVASSSKGILIPRMRAIDRDNIPSPATGLTVFVIDDNSFYYYDGASWIRLQQSGKSWLLQGNAGTDSNSDFIGTTDAQDLVFKTNGNTHMIIDRNGFVGINITPGLASLAVGGSSTTSGILSAASGGTVFGGTFYNTDANGTAIVGAGNNLGIVFLSSGSGMGGVGTRAGIYGYGSNSSDGTGIVGIGNGLGQYYVTGNGAGAAFTGDQYGIAAYATQNSNDAIAVYAVFENSNSYDGTGIYGYSYPDDNYGFGVKGYGGYIGVYGVARNGLTGVYGYSDNSTYAVVANGDLAVTGAKSFVIDHPADPENKYLKHFSIESNEILNVYRGNVTLDSQGKAVVQLPGYFYLINRNFSYTLTPVGSPAPGLFIAREIDENGTFEIAGGNPEQKISWYVYAERNDPYFQYYPEKRKVVIEKKPKEKGKYLRPEIYGQPAEKGIDFEVVSPHQSVQKPIIRQPKTRNENQ